jgi:hypothetical protein
MGLGGFTRFAPHATRLYSHWFYNVGNYISFCHFAAVHINMFENVKADNSLNICAITAEIISLRHIHKFLLSYQEFGLNLALQLLHKKSFCKSTLFFFIL